MAIVTMVMLVFALVAIITVVVSVIGLMWLMRGIGSPGGTSSEGECENHRQRSEFTFHHKSPNFLHDEFSTCLLGIAH